MKPWIESAGGGGSGGSVITDGTSITGLGTNASKIREVPVPAFISIGREDATSPSVANKVTLSGFILTSATQFSNIWLDVRGHDTNPIDVGIYNAAGTLVADAGPTVITSNSIQGIPILVPATILPPGLYLLGITAKNTAFIFTISSAQLAWGYDAGTITSALGQLPSTITPPAFALQGNSVNFGLN